MSLFSARNSFLAVGLVSTMVLASCATAPETEVGKSDLERDAAAALAKAEGTDATLDLFLRNAAGYAVFPKIGKGAVGIGGAYGKGVLYERGMVTGFCDLSQASIGLALGGQGYSEIITFQNQEAINSFKSGKLAFDAQATAVAVKSGAGANAKFHNGVYVFTFDESGLMGEASLGGQRFSYLPK
ncbi:MAG: YSC84-related protein [Phycisphaerales bacterium]